LAHLQQTKTKIPVSYFKKIGITFLSKLLIAVLNLFVLIITARQLGAEVRGQIGLLMVVLAAGVIVAELLGGPVLVYWTNRVKNKLLLQYAYGWILLVSVVIVLPVYYFQLVPGIYLPMLVPLLFFLAASGANAHILLGREKVLFFNVCGIIGPLYLFLVCIFVIQKVGFGFHQFVFHLVISYFLSWILSSIFLFKTAHRMLPFHQEGLGLLAIMKTGLYNQSSSLFTLAGSRLNFVLLETSLGISAVGIFSSALSFAEAVLIIPGSISLVLVSTLVNKKLEQQSRKSIFIHALTSGLLTLVAMLVLWMIPESFFNYLLGKDFTGVHALFLSLLPGIVCLGTGSVFTHYFSGNGLYHFNALISLGGLVVWAVASNYFSGSEDAMQGAGYAFSFGWFFVLVMNLFVFSYFKPKQVLV
jgi:O-antigen/teichoic acid export membrane protein